MAQCLVPISIGELLDKITILEIKSERISDPAKLENVRKELGMLQETWTALGIEDADVPQVMARLREVNGVLWEIEDAIREREADGDFGTRFIELARAVYVTNDERAALKREINRLTGSDLVEEKSYRDYQGESGG